MGIYCPINILGDNMSYDKYGNTIEHIDKEEYAILLKIKNKNYRILKQIKDSNKCFGDKVREITEKGVTGNTIYARKLLEMI